MRSAAPHTAIQVHTEWVEGEGRREAEREEERL